MRPQSRLSWAVWGCLLLASAVARLGAGPVAPLGPGAWPVGSSNLAVSGNPPQPMIDYLKGKATRREQAYLADILTARDSVVATELAIPADGGVYGRLAGTKLPLVLYVLYPTTPANRREAYAFPYAETGDNVFPHMQRAGERPILGEAGGAGGKFPLIVFSHGFEGHGLWDLQHLKVLAAHGYIVASVFHGDGRMSFESGVKLRPLELRAAIDCLLAHPDFGPAIDAERVGVSGGSFGGYTVLTALGGKYRGDATPPRDPRIKAGFGLVPFMGASLGFWPFSMEVWPFGKDYAGLRAVRTPFLAVYAEKDGNVPRATVEAGVRQIGGVASAVMLDGEKHLVSNATWTDICTWEVMFFDAWLKGDAAARKQLYGATSVEGGVNDHRTYLHAGGVEPAP